MTFYQDLKNFIASNKKPLIVLLGPTASGKTAFSLHIAKHVNGEIISTDSRQIYKEMTISTDALPPQQQQGVPHHMIEIVNPDQTLSMAEFIDKAQNSIEEIYQRGHIPMLVGGTNLYVSALIDAYDLPRIPPNPELRNKLEKEAQEKGHEYLHNKLKELDPLAAEKIHPNNLRYIIRALEINLTTGQNKTDHKKHSPYQPYLIGINRDRQEIYERINKRVDEQVHEGLIEEVTKLLEKYPENLPSMSSLGVKEIIPYIKGEQTLEEATEILKRNTRRYAKRQMTWLRKYANVNWLTPTEITQIIQNNE